MAAQRIGGAGGVLSVVGHKFYGPRIGALFHAESAPVVPIFLGGGQEKGRRSGTENTPMIVGLGKAAEIVTKRLDGDAKHFEAMRKIVTDAFERKLGEF